MANRCLLHHSISALRVITESDGKNRIGLLTQLPRNAEIEICGEGFDDRTVTVRLGDSLYFAFRADVQMRNESKDTA